MTGSGTAHRTGSDERLRFGAAGDPPADLERPAGVPAADREEMHIEPIHGDPSLAALYSVANNAALLVLACCGELVGDAAVGLAARAPRHKH